MHPQKHPNLALLSSTELARKASLNALTGNTDTSPTGFAQPASKMAGPESPGIDVGDLVDVPGSMHGVVKFIGPVRGRKGIFAGVELSNQYATRGKNDGQVDGYVCLCPRYGADCKQRALLLHLGARIWHISTRPPRVPPALAGVVRFPSHPHDPFVCRSLFCAQVLAVGRPGSPSTKPILQAKGTPVPAPPRVSPPQRPRPRPCLCARAVLWSSGLVQEPDERPPIHKPPERCSQGLSVRQAVLSDKLPRWEPSVER
jgi:hypothetical protein